MPDLCFGRIVWSVVADKNGKNAYPRPVVILTPQEEISTATELFGVVASHTAANQRPRPHYMIEIPHHPQGLVRTKLKRPTVAVCNWVTPIDSKLLRASDFGGIVPPQVLELIVSKIRELYSA